YGINLGNEMFYGDVEDDMLDIRFDKVAKDGGLSPGQQRRGSFKTKRMTHGMQHSWDGKLSWNCRFWYPIITATIFESGNPRSPSFPWTIKNVWIIQDTLAWSTPRVCTEHLEFLGVVVLDYVVTTHLYFKYSRLIPRLITYLRSTFVNDECYAQSAVKAIMYEHILHASPDLQRKIFCTVEDFEKLDLVSTFGWESETTFPNVLGDVIESLARV
ncbi:hypothetical protein MTR67_000715, partial [Solanum verrucosum]